MYTLIVVRHEESAPQKIIQTRTHQSFDLFPIDKIQTVIKR